jgi:hypothetical protein
MQRWLLLLASFLIALDTGLLMIRPVPDDRPRVAPPLFDPMRPLPPTPVRPSLVPPAVPAPAVPKFIAVPAYRAGEAGTVYGDIISHSRGAPFGLAHGRDVDAHETTHGINSEIRNANQRAGARVNGFYVLQGRGVLVEDPNIKMQNALRFVPKNLRSYRWPLYMEQQIKSWNDTPTYILDEWVAYVNGGQCGVDDVRQGKWRGQWTDVVSGCCDFSFYAVALAMATKADDPRYWDSHPQLRDFLVWELKAAERTFLEGRTMKQFKWKKQDDLLLAFLESPDAAPMRAFCRAELDGAWVGIDPAVIRNTDYTDSPTEVADDILPQCVLYKKEVGK